MHFEIIFLPSLFLIKTWEKIVFSKTLNVPLQIVNITISGFNPHYPRFTFNKLEFLIYQLADSKFVYWEIQYYLPIWKKLCQLAPFSSTLICCQIVYNSAHVYSKLLLIIFSEGNEAFSDDNYNEAIKVRLT